MKKILILISLNFLLLASDDYVDFGEKGALYNIAEDDIQEKAIEKLKQMDFSDIKTKINAEVKKRKTYKGSVEFSRCKGTSFNTITDMWEAQITTRDIYGNIVSLKGEKYPNRLPEGIKVDLCIVDGSNKKSLKKQMEYFSTNVKKCIYFVVDMDLDEFTSIYKKQAQNSSVFNKMLKKRFNISCYPSHLHMYDDQIDYSYFRINDEGEIDD